MLEETSFLGTGWAFPPRFIKQADKRNIIEEEGAESIEIEPLRSGAEVEMVSGQLDINQSLHVLLSTSIGERVLQPLYGCNLEDYVFRPMNSSQIGFIQNLVENAILYHEARIETEKVVVESKGRDHNEGRLHIEVVYRIRETNSRYNFVYDFYLREGVGLINV